MAITALPTPPSRDDPTNFVTRADNFLGALPTFATEANEQADIVNTQTASASASAAQAQASAVAAVGAANYKGDYVAGTTYQVGQSVSSGGKIWIAKTINLGITPVEGTRWTELKSSNPPFQDPITLAQVQAISLSF